MPKNSMYGAWPASGMFFIFLNVEEVISVLNFCILVAGEIDIVETRGNVNYAFGNVTSAASTLQWGPSMDLNAYLDTHVEVLVDNGKSFADNFHTWGEYLMNKALYRMQKLTISVQLRFGMGRGWPEDVCR